MTDHKKMARDDGHRDMTPDRFTELRELLDLSVAQLARQLDVTPDVVRAMEEGNVPIDRRTTMAMQWLAVCQTGIVSRSWSIGPKRDVFGVII